MTASEKYNVVKQACDEKKICQIQHKRGDRPWTIHPVGICLTSNRGLVIVCCVDVSDNIDGAKAVVSNIPIEDCSQISLTDQKCIVSPEAIEQAKICDDWLFHI